MSRLEVIELEYKKMEEKGIEKDIIIQLCLNRLKTFEEKSLFYQKINKKKHH